MDFKMRAFMSHRQFIAVKIVGKKNVGEFVEWMFIMKKLGMAELKSVHWNRLTILKLLTDRKIIVDCNEFYVQLVIRNLSWKDRFFCEF